MIRSVIIKKKEIKARRDANRSLHVFLHKAGVEQQAFLSRWLKEEFSGRVRERYDEESTNVSGFSLKGVLG